MGAACCCLSKPSGACNPLYSSNAAGADPTGCQRASSDADCQCLCCPLPPPPHCLAQAEVPGVCTGGLTRNDNQTLNVSLAVLASSPECSLRVTLVPELSLRA